MKNQGKPERSEVHGKNPKRINKTDTGEFNNDNMVCQIQNVVYYGKSFRLTIYYNWH